MSKRLHYIDWLRVLAVLLLFPFHTSRVFNFGDPFYIKSVNLSMALNYVLGFIDRWHMPLLFLLAGASTYFSLSKRTAGQYTSERFLRLGIPLVFGILVLIPPQTWIGARYNSGYTGSYWQYISSGAFLKINFGPGGDYYGGFGVGQLWFILFLLIISLVVLPLVVWGRGRGTQRVQGWARRLARPTWWWLPPVFILVGEALPDVVGKNIFYYGVFFVLGYIVIADGTFAQAAEKHRWVGLGLGTVLCAAWVALGPTRDSLPDPSLQLAALNYVTGWFGIWMMLIGMLGAGKRYLDRPSPALSYLAEASYPVYILHQTLIVMAAFVIVRWPVGLVPQWIAVFVVAVAATFALYEGVRRVGALRFLFGMRPRPKAPAAAA
jgi:glucan biosynthesis protein C